MNAPATMSVVSAETIETSPAQNYGDLLRSVPGLNVIQMSARDINMTSRQGTSTLSNSQLALLDGRSIYLDFFGLILWDFVPTQPVGHQADRGRARARLRGLGRERPDRRGQHHHQDAARVRGRQRDPERGDVRPRRGLDEGTRASRTAPHGTWSGAPNDRWSYRLAAGYFQSDAFSRPTGTIPRLRPIRWTATIVHRRRHLPRLPDNQGTKQPKVDLRVDQELTSGGRITYSGGYAGTEGIVHTGIGPFDLQSGSYLGYGRVGLRPGRLPRRRLS